MSIPGIVFAGIGTLAMGETVAMADVAQSQAINVSIPAESLADALTDLAAQAGIQVFFSSQLVAGLRGPALKGSLSVTDALSRLLLNTNLHYEFVNAHTITILSGGQITTNNQGDSSMTNRGSMARIVGTLVACGSLAHAGTTCAQDTTAQADASPGLEEVVVTAERREENAQSVPITIESFSDKQLSSLAITSTLQLMDFTPGLNITRANAGAVPFLRGVGNFNSALGAEATVATFVDEVYRPGPGASIFGFNNVAQVTVLNGPQGTLFGRNAAGGVISVMTKDPTSTPELDSEIGYANYNTVSGSFYAAGGVTTNLAADIAVDLSNQETGWGKNYFDGTDAYLSNETSLRSKWIFTPDAADKFTLIGYFDKLRNDQAWAQAIYPGTVQNLGYTHVGGFYDLDTNLDGHGININDGASLKVDHSFNSFDLISISAYGASIWTGIIENDASPANEQQSRLNSTEETWQQELRVASSSGSKIVWTAGLYLFIDTAHPDPNYKIGTSIGSITAYPNLVATYWDTQDTTSYSPFGQATVPLGDSTHLTLGARYTEDKRRFHGIVTNSLGAVEQATPGVETENNGSPTYRAALDHNFSSTTLGYVSYNRGFKSGSFNTGGILQPPTLPETVDAYEVGFKSDLTSTLRLNMAAFLNRFNELQVLQQTIQGPISTNAGEAEYKGVDLSIISSPINNLTLTLGSEYLDAYYARYTNALFYFPAANGLGMVSQVENATGYTIPFAEKFNLSSTANYLLNTVSGSYAFTTGWAFHNGFTYDPQGLTTQPSYWMANASVKWISLSKKWDAQIWGDNLLNKQLYAQRQVQAVGFTYSPGAPRTYGVKVGYHLK